MTSEAAVRAADDGDRTLVWITIEETPDPDLAARIERCLFEHHVTTRVLEPGDVPSDGDSLIEVQVPEPEFERALDALEEIDDALEP